MRLRFQEAPASTKAIPWQNKRDKLPPDDTTKSLTAVFSIAGRTAEQGFYEFSQDDPGFLPIHGTFNVIVEARLAHRKTFQTLVSFELDTKRVSGQANYLAYSNDPVFD
jgi:hypothetical protein